MPPNVFFITKLLLFGRDTKSNYILAFVLFGVYCLGNCDVIGKIVGTTFFDGVEIKVSNNIRLFLGFHTQK